MGKSTGGVGGLISGKVGGNVFYVVDGEQRIRELTPVHNPQTPRQMEVRAINVELSRVWRDVLNQGQRTAWEQRAASLGTKGSRLFLKQNFPLVDFGYVYRVTPPPQVMPPELFDLVIGDTAENLTLDYVPLSPAIVTAQAPFLSVEIAGGFTLVNLNVNPAPGMITTEVYTEALSAGRVHQESDFVFAAYVPDPAFIAEPFNKIIGIIPDGTVRNIVFRVKRINKYGNQSAARVINAIITAPALA